MLTITNFRYNIYVVQYTRHGLSQGKNVMFIEIYVEMKGKINFAQGVQYKVIGEKEREAIMMKSSESSWKENPSLVMTTNSVKGILLSCECSISDIIIFFSIVLSLHHYLQNF